MKGNLSVSPTFEPLQFKKCKVVLMQPLLFYDQKRLYLQDGRSILWESKPIINVTYSKEHGVIMILCEDWKLYILTENLNILTKIRWDSKYTVCFKLIENIKAFLMIGVSEVHLAYIDIRCNCRQTKFLSSMKCEISVKDASSNHAEGFKNNWTLSVQEDTKLKWHKGYQVFQKENLLLVWSLQDINFYRLNTLEILSHVQNITKKQVPISKVSYNTYYKYTIVGYANGTLRIWKIPLNNYQKKEMIHMFENSNKPIVDIIPAEDERMFMSQSSDCKVCLWNIDTFEMVYFYDFGSECSKLHLCDYRIFYAEEDSIMMRGMFGIPLQFVTNINNSIVFFDKKLEKIELDQSQQSKISSIQFTLSSNLGIKIDMEDLAKKDINKSNLQYFYPPLKSKSILQILASPFEDNKFYYLIENGQIYKTRIQGTIAKIQRLYDVSHILSNEIPSIIKFLRILPPQFDSQFRGRISSEDTKALNSLAYSERDRMFKNKQLLAIGCSKGSIIFLQKSNMNKAYVRISYHRQKVIFLQSLYHKQSDKYFLISMCEQNWLKVVAFEDDRSNCVYSVNCQKGISRLMCHEDYAFMTFPKGIFQIFKTDDQGHLWFLDNQQATDHDDEIQSMDLDKKNHLIMTTGQDQKIKIWNYSKMHIITISVKESLHGAYFANDLNLFILHENKLSVLRNHRLRISKKNIDQWKMAEDQQTLLLPFAEYLESLMKKQKKTNKLYRIKSLVREQHINSKSFQKQQKKKSTNVSMVVEPQSKKQKIKASEPSKQAKKQSKERGKSFSSDSQMLNKHFQNLNAIRRNNMQHLPRIAETKESLFDQFMRMKLLNKKILTRRDITLNRIIMKNIVKEYLGSEMIEGLNGVKAP